MIATWKSPAVGISYMLWLRLRWWIAGLIAYTVVLLAMIHASPWPLEVSLLGIFGVAAIQAPMLTSLSLGPVDLGARGSGFPRDMLVLPLRTTTLVGWPMFYGVLTNASLWIISAALIFKPVGLD